MGYQYWLQIFVSPGWRKLKSGWLSVIYPGHDLNVRRRFTTRIRVGQIAVPCITKFVIPPGPLLLPGGDMVIAKMDYAGLGKVVIPAKEILLAAHAHI